MESSDFKCMVDEQVFGNAITIRPPECFLLSSNIKGSSFCLSFAHSSRWGRLSNSPHLDPNGRIKISVRATFLISALDPLPRTGESG